MATLLKCSVCRGRGSTMFGAPGSSEHHAEICRACAGTGGVRSALDSIKERAERAKKAAEIEAIEKRARFAERAKGRPLASGPSKQRALQEAKRQQEIKEAREKMVTINAKTKEIEPFWVTYWSVYPTGGAVSQRGGFADVGNGKTKTAPEPFQAELVTSWHDALLTVLDLLEKTTTQPAAASTPRMQVSSMPSHHGIWVRGDEQGDGGSKGIRATRSGGGVSLALTAADGTEMTGIFAKLPEGLKHNESREALQAGLLRVQSFAGVPENVRYAAQDFLDRQHFNAAQVNYQGLKEHVVGTFVQGHKTGFKNLKALRDGCPACDKWWDDRTKQAPLHQHLLEQKHVAKEWAVQPEVLAPSISALKEGAFPIEEVVSLPRPLPAGERRIGEMLALYQSTTTAAGLQRLLTQVDAFNQVLEVLGDDARIYDIARTKELRAAVVSRMQEAVGETLGDHKTGDLYAEQDTETCTSCSGSGIGYDTATCSACGGSGFKPFVACTACSGSGGVLRPSGQETCTACNGTGVAP